MNFTLRPNRDLVYKDAVYFSMHKFVGGVQTPGVLVAKRILFRAGEKYPDGCGGGSVCFVRRNNQVYLKVGLHALIQLSSMHII